jgi:TolB-like protein
LSVLRLEECPSPTTHNHKFERGEMRGSLRFILAVVLLFLAGAMPGCASAPVTPSGPAAVAVWDLEDLSPGAAGEQGMGEVLSLRIVETARARGLSVVERQKLLLAAEELRLGSSALADESTRLRLGRITGARQMVFGGYLTVGNRVRMDLRLVDVETGKVLRTSSRTGPAGGIQALLELCGKAADDLFP